MNWIEAIRGKAPVSCPFEYAAPLTEVMLLGIVSLRAGQKTPGDSKIHYDGAKNEEAVIQVWGMGPATSTPAEKR